MTSKLIGTRTYKKEYKGAKVKFTRKDGKRTHVVYVGKYGDGFAQWGAPYPILCDNFEEAQKWWNTNILQNNQD